MYIPIMKNQAEELRVIRDMNFFFDDSIIPLIEIIKDEYDIKYKIDETGEFIYEKKPGKKRRNKVELPKTEEDIITLEDINKRLNGKKGFIDYFRFSENEYDNIKDFNKVELSVRLSRDFNYYRKRILQIGNYSNLVPVISIKKDLNNSEYDLRKLISDLRRDNSIIAIRITDPYLDDYMEFIEDHLTEKDFVMLDIRNQNVDSKFLELEDFQDLDTNAYKILLNSPRSKDDKNGDFENLKITRKIDNKVAVLFKDYEFNGFGDFGGLKDTLPASSGGNGMGAALGLIYLKEDNAFYSIVQTDTSRGVRGFKYVREEVLKRLSYLDSDNDCIAIKRIKEMDGTYGTWSTWSNIILTRYIQQQTKR